LAKVRSVIWKISLWEMLLLLFVVADGYLIGKLFDSIQRLPGQFALFEWVFRIESNKRVFLGILSQIRSQQRRRNARS
jgi:hypothetical protein